MDMKNYKRAYEKFEVPQELIRETMSKTCAAESNQIRDKSQPIRIGWWGYTALGAMCLAIVMMIPSFIQTYSTDIIVTQLVDGRHTESVTLTNGYLRFHQSAVFSIPLHFANAATPGAEPGEPSVAVTMEEGGFPEQYDQSLVLDSVMNGIPLYVGVDSQNDYYAQFVHDGNGYYIVGMNISQEGFIREIFGILK
jgi:hypothetical protein